MPVIEQYRIHRVDLRNNPDALYLFGDNCERVGMGGQAGEMRGEPNAVGVATKLTPTSGSNAFFTDDLKYLDIFNEDLKPAIEHLKRGGIVVIPSDGLGTGLSELPTRAPKLDLWLKAKLNSLKDI